MTECWFFGRFLLGLFFYVSAIYIGSQTLLLFKIIAQWEKHLQSLLYYFILSRPPLSLFTLKDQDKLGSDYRRHDSSAVNQKAQNEVTGRKAEIFGKQRELKKMFWKWQHHLSVNSDEVLSQISISLVWIHSPYFTYPLD